MQVLTEMLRNRSISIKADELALRMPSCDARKEGRYEGNAFCDAEWLATGRSQGSTVKGLPESLRIRVHLGLGAIRVSSRTALNGGE